MSERIIEPIAPEEFHMESARWATGRNALMLAALVSVAASVGGYFTDTDRFMQSYLVAFVFTTVIGLGALFFTQVQYLSGSAWSVVIRRVMENLMWVLPMGAILFIPIALNLDTLYPWTDRALMASNEMLEGKSGFLAPSSFITRTYIYFGLWSLWVWQIYRNSIKQDTERSAKRMHVLSRWSAPGLPLVVVVGTLASFDWLMSLEPAWYSTIFGLYYLADGALGFFAVLTLVMMALAKSGVMHKALSHEHFHDLGKWLFAMTCFYTYIAFSQYMLIWYADMPEETVFFRHRAEGEWLVLSLALPFLRFFIPFFALLARPAKRTLALPRFIAVWSLVVVYLDMYWLVIPNFHPDGLDFYWTDLAALGTTVSLAGLAFWYRFQKNKIVPVGDLRLQQSLRFENV